MKAGVQRSLDPALVTRFRDDVTALGVRPTAAAPLALAVSGGPDSMAMLALAADAFPDAIATATVDHRLRPANADEAAMVADWCAAAGIPHEILVATGAQRPGENLHVWARTMRYRLLAGWCDHASGAALATAHHADDQAETFLMRAGRGSGLSGLAGVRAKVNGVIRPLLQWRRSTLRGIVEAADIPFVDDPSNVDPRFDRSRLRAWLAETDALDAAQIGRSARQLGEIDADLRAFASELWEARSRASEDGAMSVDVAGLPRTLRRYLVALALERIGGGPVERQFEPLLDALEAGSSATQHGVLARARGPIWTFQPAPARRR